MRDPLGDLDRVISEIEADLHAGSAARENRFRREMGRTFEEAMRAANLDVPSLAKKMDIPVVQVERLLHHLAGGDLSLRTMFRAALVLNLDLNLSVGPSPGGEP